MSSTAAVTFREMTRGDVGSMARLEATVSPRPWSEDLFAGELKMSWAERHWVVAIDSVTSDLVGFGGVMFVAADGRIVEGHIMNVAVDPERQGHGLGRRLLDELVGVSKERGAESLTLEVRVDNKAALALYRRAGFAPVGVRSGYYGHGEDALVMWLHDLQSVASGPQSAAAAAEGNEAEGEPSDV